MIFNFKIFGGSLGNIFKEAWVKSWSKALDFFFFDSIIDYLVDGNKRENISEIVVEVHIIERVTKPRQKISVW